MMREFILRHRLPERRKEAHQVLEIMPDTYGIMVYQEDVIKVAHAFAHLTLGEADVLRRGMSGKYRSRAEFQAIKTKFFKNCADLQYGQDITEEVWRQIESLPRLCFCQGTFRLLCRRKLSSPLSKDLLPLGVHGGDNQ